MLTPCAKAGCFHLAQDRHHMGSEAMWLRHFKPRSRTKRYKAFRLRYKAFESQDISPLCRSCHEDITSLNWELIIVYMRAFKPAACSTWTWEEAESMMAFLRRKYTVWVATPVSAYPIKGILETA